ncbi:MAG: decarboxylating NADP(+)-dependent phosphogluconate dehydrogenase [Clostridiales bacterium]|nr:decarboxylating NADP(+)-dependent phosphogluconate dehydrogenase [Clostridiales bacterium]
MKRCDIGVIGLAVMGENLALNMASKGFSVCVYNRSPEKVKGLVEGRAKGKEIAGADSLEELVGSLKKPRKVMLMVKAGKPVDDLIGLLVPLLEKGDVIIDGGNSQFQDTRRRAEYVESKGLLFVGTGVSGGEEGALKGPSIMPGGSEEAWPLVKPVFQAIAAKVDGEPCCDWVGSGGAGHFVKMVHNGIEYGDIQLICEAYHLMRDCLGMGADELHSVFSEWAAGELDSFLIDITRDIFAYRDADGEPLIDKILDKAEQKGTGKWVSITALDEGVPLTLINEAVYSRCLSAMKAERMAASKVLAGPKASFSGDRAAFSGDRAAFIDDIQKALFASKIVSYAQGYALMRAASETYGWGLDFGGIAMMWRGGCIIRSQFLGKIKDAYCADKDLGNLLMAPFFKESTARAQDSWRRVVSEAVMNGIPVPAFSSALAYYDGYRCERLPANLLQAQRDYFGAHTYERADRPEDGFVHTDWTGIGGQ